MWIVVSVCWVCFASVATFQIWTGHTDRISLYEKKIPELERENEMMKETQNSLPKIKSNLDDIEVLKSAIKGKGEQRWNGFLLSISAMFLPPLGLLLLFYIVAWVGKGFIKQE